MRRRPIYLIGSVVVITFCTIFFLTFLDEGLPSDMVVGVVDMDDSYLSREFCRQLDATQLSAVVKYGSFEEARQDLQSGKINSFCVLPKGMYADVNANRQPVFEYYLNGLYFVGGALAYRDILTMINLANGAVQREVLRAKGFTEDQIMGLIQPIVVDTHQIGNVYTSYSYYLSNIMIPGLLEMVIIIVLIYSLGSEMKYGTSRHLLKTSGDSITTALTGKLLVYTALFSTLGFIMVLVLYKWMHFPIAGSIWNMFLAIFLLVIASESIAIFILGCLPVTRLSLSIGALYSVLAFSMSGFSLPVENMPRIIRGWAWAFPLRHYYQFYVQEVVFGTGFAGWWREAVHLLVFLLLPPTVMPRLKKAYQLQNFPRE